MENIDLVQSLLPQLKDVILELKERQVELGKGELIVLIFMIKINLDMKKVPKGFISQLKWRIDKIIDSKKDTVKLQKRLDNLIDQTTAVIRPKLIGKNFASFIAPSLRNLPYYSFIFFFLLA